MENRTGEKVSSEVIIMGKCEEEEKIGFCSGSAEKLLRQFSFSFLIIIINNEFQLNFSKEVGCSSR